MLMNQEELIKSVGIIIRTTDERVKEIVLEPWQAEVFIMLGLQVKSPGLDDYSMYSKSQYEKKRNEYVGMMKFYRKKLFESIQREFNKCEIYTRSDYYRLNDEQKVKLYATLQPLQEEFYLEKDTLVEWVEMAVHEMDV